MTRTLPTTLIIAGLTAAGLVAMARPSLAQSTPPRSQDMTTGSTTSAPSSGLRYESDGNAKNPAGRVSTDVPSYQQGSGQETGGPAKELIPR